MDNVLDPTLSALLATLEDRAKKHGEKSILRGVIERLAASGADEALVAQVSALRPSKAAKPKPVAKAKAHRKANGKSDSGASKAEGAAASTAAG
jgi:hypothetical protein